MGSWNETCAISRLAIHSREAVRFLPIVQNPWSYTEVGGWPDGTKPLLLKGESAVCFTDLWGFFAYPLRAVYNDYGSIEEIRDKTPRDKAESEQFLNLFRRHTVPLTIGDNSYHDVPTIDLDMPKTLEALREGRIYFRMFGRVVPVSQIMIKEHVWQSLLTVNLMKVDSSFAYRVKNGEKKPTIRGMMAEYKKKSAMFVAASKRTAPLPLNLELHRTPAFSSPVFPPPIFDEDYDHRPSITTNRLGLARVAAELDYVSLVLPYLRITIQPTSGSGSQDDNHQLWATVAARWAEDEQAAQKERMKGWE